MKFEKLFEPINIGKMVIKNRIAMSPMGTFGLMDPDGGLTQRALDYYSERARGGVGLIISGVARVTEIEPRFGRFFVSAKTLPSIGELVESVHFQGAKIFIQLTAGVGRVLGGSLIDQGATPVSASANPCFWRPKVTARELTIGEIEEIVKALGDSARLLKSVGVDGIELHGHQGYLFDQFAAAIWNQRKDKYGGALMDRLRLAIEALNSIKDKAGSDFPVTYRYGLKHFMKGPQAGALEHEHYIELGRDLEEGVEVSRILEKAGFDALHVDGGCYESLYWPFPPLYQPHGCMVGLASEVKKAVCLPVITVGRLDDPELAEKVLQEKKADMVALGRALLADPHWPKKVWKGEEQEIRPCIACNDGCLYRTSVEFKPLSCSVNPTTGRERTYSLGKAGGHGQRVLIAGGGIAGMEAARIAAMRGQRVILCERTETLGGHLIAGSVPEFKKAFRKLLEWYMLQLEKLAIEIRLQTEATPELIRKEKPDKVVIATGSVPLIPKIPGIEKPMVVTCLDLLLKKKSPGKNVIVVGGGLVGCETALWLAQQGRRVSIVEALSELCPGIHHANRVMLLDMLKEKNVICLTRAELRAITDDGITILDETGEKIISGDTVALALGLEPKRELYEALRKDFYDLHLVGDCKEPGKIGHAIWDAFHVASSVIDWI